MYITEHLLKKLLNFTKGHLKVGDKASIKKPEKKMAADLKINDSINKLHKEEAFIIIKNHKLNYQNNPQYRLLNPTKNNIGKIR